MSYEIPYSTDYTEWYGTPQNVTRLSAVLEQTTDEDGNNVGMITASWDVPDNGGTFNVLTSTDGETYTLAVVGLRNNTTVFNVAPNTDYYIKVITVLDSLQSEGTVSNLLSIDIPTPSAPVLTVLQGGISIDVGIIPSNYIAVINIDDGTTVTTIDTNEPVYTYMCVAGEYSVTVAYEDSVGNVGNESTPAVASVEELATKDELDDYIEKTSADYIKSASVNQSGDTLTLTKGDDTSVTFQGGGYTLPIASANALGGIKVGSNLSIDENGVLSAIGGGGGLSITDILFTSPNGSALEVNQNIVLSNGWNNYDFLVFSGGGVNRMNNFVLTRDLEPLKGSNDNVLNLRFNNGNGSGETVCFKIVDYTNLVCTRTGYTFNYIYGVKFGSGGSSYTETVLFSDSSGVSSGTINLSGNLSDYDLIEIHYRNPSHSAKAVVSQIVSLTDFISGTREIGYNGYDNHYRWISYVSDTSVSVGNGSNYNVYKIIGIKLGGGGGGGSSYTAGDGIDISNDVISLDVASANDIGGIKVGSGLSIDANGVLSAIGGGGGGGGSSYSETVLFSSSSGVSSGTITLSGNISDYDLINIATGGSSIRGNIFLSSEIQRAINDGKAILVSSTYNNDAYNIIFSCTNNSFTITNNTRTLTVWKIIGIKIGGGSSLASQIASLEARIQALESQLS